MPAQKICSSALATVNVTAHAAGEVTQDTGPSSFLSGAHFPLTWTPESESFTVNVTPEPTTAFLLIATTAILARRQSHDALELAREVVSV